MPSVSSDENALPGILDAARPIPAPRVQRSADEIARDWSKPERIAARQARVDFALERLERAEAQQDLTPQDRACRLLPFLCALWWGELDSDHPADRRAGALPYPPPRYRPDSPWYVAELDE